MRTGAYDCLFKPFSLSRLRRTVECWSRSLGLRGVFRQATDPFFDPGNSPGWRH